MTILQSIGRIWSSAPGDLLGRLVLAASGVTGPTRQVDLPDGTTALVVEDARLGRYLDAAPTRPFAQTLGRYVLARERIPEVTLRHELVHVGQWQRLGPVFVPAYLAASLVARLGGGDAYQDNVFESQARRSEVLPGDSGTPDAAASAPR